MNSLKRFLTPMLSDHQTRYPSQGGIRVDPSPTRSNPNRKVTKVTRFSITLSSLTYSVSEKRSYKKSSLSSLNDEQQQLSGLGATRLPRATGAFLILFWCLRSLPNTNFHRKPCAECWKFNNGNPNGQDPAVLGRCRLR